MLGGRNPVIIFQLSKLADSVGSQLARVPVISQIPTLIEQPPIPIYFSEEFTGVYIDSEDKNVDIETTTETLSNAATPDVQQKGIVSGVTIKVIGKKDSVALTLLSAMIDLIFDKVTAKEYSISYLNGATTIFRGVLHSFAANQTANNDLVSIEMRLSKGEKKPTKAPDVPAVDGFEGATPLG